MSQLSIVILQYLNIAALLFTATMILFYTLFAVISIGAMKHHIREDSFVDYNALLSSECAPAVSLIAPAYNEAKTIEENVRSLLSLEYSDYEVIIVNDGSKDDSMDILINAYQLKKIDTEVVPRVQSKPIKGVYKSDNPALKKLTVVDKVNGGKSDALNAGICVSQNPYIACIDVDCVLEKQSLLRMIKPFMDESGRRVIAAGGVVRIANSCIIKAGRLLEVKVPDKFLPRVQVLEYIRAFLLGRMAWSKLDGLLLISGAFGMFDKEIVVAVGGYSHKTVGEDMELVVRMRRYMVETGQPYTVRYIPDPLCWTEAPDNYDILIKQRNRWTRGTMETLLTHRRILFNPKYRILGLLSFPYWLIYEYAAPIIEFVGFFATLILALLGLLSWKFFFLIFGFIYSFTLMYACLSLLSEEFTYHQYTRRSDFLKLFITAMIEPIWYHPVTVYASIKGNIQKMRGIGGWGEMTRQGFTKKT